MQAVEEPIVARAGQRNAEAEEARIDELEATLVNRRPEVAAASDQASRQAATAQLAVEYGKNRLGRRHAAQAEQLEHQSQVWHLLGGHLPLVPCCLNIRCIFSWFAL